MTLGIVLNWVASETSNQNWLYSNGNFYSLGKQVTSSKRKVIPNSTSLPQYN